MLRVAFVVLACAVAGCLTRGNSTTAPVIARSLAPAQPAEGLIIDSILLERPLGDQFLDRDLWRDVLPVGSPEVQTLLAENGLRVGIVTGSGPRKFQTFLESDVDTVSPQRMTFHLRKEAVLPTAGPIESCKFDVLTDLAGKPKVFDLKQVRCGVQVRPQLGSDGRVKLQCEPQLQHGIRQEWFRPNEDATQFTRQEEMPLEKFAALAFEATLGTEDYLVIGWRAEDPETLGSAMFAAEADGRPRQRVLVVRARNSGPQVSNLPIIGGAGKRPSAAAQAASPK